MGDERSTFQCLKRNIPEKKGYYILSK